MNAILEIEEVIRRNLQNYKKEKVKQVIVYIDATLIGNVLAKHFPYSMRTKDNKSFGFGEFDKGSFSFPVSDKKMEELVEENDKREEKLLRRKAYLEQRRMEFDNLKKIKHERKIAKERIDLERKRKSVCGQFLDIPLSVAKVG